MSTGAIVAIVVAVVVVLVLVGAVVVIRRRGRSRALRNQFGPEYDRMVELTGDSRAAENELATRADERSKLTLRELPSSELDRFKQEWRRIQAEFVDSPVRSLAQADSLLTEVMGSRGYPIDQSGRSSELVSVDHPHLMDQYRRAHETQAQAQRGEASTENVREALVSYRALFADLLDAPGDEAAQPNRR